MAITLPYSNPTTSYAAAKRAVPKSAQDRRAICASIAAAGAKGLTDEEIAAACPGVNANAIRVRRGELAGRGFITSELGERRNTTSGNAATVWHIRKRGLFALDLPMSEWGVV